MNFSLHHRIMAAAGFLLLCLIGLVVFETRARAAGREVILEVGLIDPRALLSGHYVALSFQHPLAEGEACPPGTADPAEPPAQSTKQDRSKWIALRAAGDTHRIAGAAPERAQAEQLGQIVLRGEVGCSPPGDTNVRLFIPNIDRFYADQQEALAIEKLIRERPEGEARVFAILSIGKDGTARTKGLMIDGKRVELGWR